MTIQNLTVHNHRMELSIEIINYVRVLTIITTILHTIVHLLILILRVHLFSAKVRRLITIQALRIMYVRLLSILILSAKRPSTPTIDIHMCVHNSMILNKIAYSVTIIFKYKTKKQTITIKKQFKKNIRIITIGGFTIIFIKATIDTIITTPTMKKLSKIIPLTIPHNMCQIQMILPILIKKISARRIKVLSISAIQ